MFLFPFHFKLPKKGKKALLNQLGIWTKSRFVFNVFLKKQKIFIFISVFDS